MRASANALRNRFTCNTAVVRRHLKVVGATLLALTAVTTNAAAASDPFMDALAGTQQPAVGPNSGDCNHNGTADTLEANWTNRDDDGDDVCNAVDNCPTEPNSDQSFGACSMQAISVPARADDPAAPHVTYSGASVTLKGIARYGGNQYMWDFGDGSASAWTSISNPYDLGVNHVYTGFVGQTFTATLTIRNSASPSVLGTALYRVVIKDGGTSLGSLTREQTDVRAQMAIDRALWYLHATLTRSTYAEGTPGYRQPYAVVPSAASGLGDTCAVVDALASNGHLASGDYHTNPYVEDARRGLNYMLANASARAITTQQAGNPDVNGNGVGVSIGPDDMFANSVCAMAFGDSAATDWLAGTGPSGVYGRPHTAVSQDLVDWLAYGQTDPSVGATRGGWGDQANIPANNQFTRWAVMALAPQAARMGATIPAFVRAEMPYFTFYTQYTGSSALNGGVGFSSPGDGFTNVGFTGGAVLSHFFFGDPASHPSVQRAIGYIARAWLENDNVWHTNLGDSNAMFSVARAFRAAQPGIRVISDYDYVHGAPVPSSAFHWYYGPAGAPQTGYAGNLLARQNAAGFFSDVTISLGNTLSYPYGRTALAAMVLVPGGAPATADVSAPSLDFGIVDLNATSPALAVSLTNQGDYDLPIDSITATGPFSATSDCGNLVSPAGEGVPNACTIQVTFTPVAVGSASGILTIAGAAGSPTTTIPLSGSRLCIEADTGRHLADALGDHVWYRARSSVECQRGCGRHVHLHAAGGNHARCRPGASADRELRAKGYGRLQQCHGDGVYRRGAGGSRDDGDGRQLHLRRPGSRGNSHGHRCVQ